MNIHEQIYSFIIKNPIDSFFCAIGLMLLFYLSWKFKILLDECKVNREKARKYRNKNANNDGLGGCYAKTSNGKVLWVSDTKRIDK